MHYFLVTGKRLACAGLAQREAWQTDLCFLKSQLRELIRALPSFSRNSSVLIEEKQPSNWFQLSIYVWMMWRSSGIMSETQQCVWHYRKQHFLYSIVILSDFLAAECTRKSSFLCKSNAKQKSGYTPWYQPELLKES